MKIKTFLPALLLVVAGVFITGYVALAVGGFSESNGLYKSRNLLVSQTASATSSPFRVVGAESITLLFDNIGPNGVGVGTTTFSVEVSIDDDINFYDYNKLITNNTSETVVSSVELTGTTTAIYTMDLRDESYYSMRCLTVKAGTTTASCKALIQY